MPENLITTRSVPSRPFSRPSSYSQILVDHFFATKMQLTLVLTCRGLSLVVGHNFFNFICMNLETSLLSFVDVRQPICHLLRGKQDEWLSFDWIGVFLRFREVILMEIYDSAWIITLWQVANPAHRSDVLDSSLFGGGSDFTNSNCFRKKFRTLQATRHLRHGRNSPEPLLVCEIQNILQASHVTDPGMYQTTRRFALY